MEVKSLHGTYTVTFGNTQDFLERLHSRRLIFVCDDNIIRNPLYQILFDLIRLRGEVIPVRALEREKTISAIGALIEALANAGASKTTELVVIGGGITQDIGALAASLYFRGIKYHLVPTTLLAQADSCIGSKSSANIGLRKNVIGSFWPPASVCIDVTWNSSLTKDDIASGVGEIIKLAVIGGDASVLSVEQRLDDMLGGDVTAIEAGIKIALQVKKNYIEEDEFDLAARRVLNYGHCVGHGVEAALEYRISHGQAVIVGMLVAMNIVEALEKAQYGSEKWKRIRGLQLRALLDRKLVKDLNDNLVKDYMLGDKKREGRGFTIMLWKGNTVFELMHNIDGDTISNAITQFKKQLS